MRIDSNLYEKDFYAWTQEQAEWIKTKKLENLDLVHLLEEVENMGNQNKTELKNRLAVLLMHLLKWKYQSEFKSHSWYLTIANQRLDITDLLEDNPSLGYFLPEIFTKAYVKSVSKAVIETGINRNVFPKECPWTIEQALEAEFFPEV